MFRVNGKLQKKNSALELDLQQAREAVTLHRERIEGLTVELRQKKQLLIEKDMQLEACQTQHKTK